MLNRGMRIEGYKQRRRCTFLYNHAVDFLVGRICESKYSRASY